MKHKPNPLKTLFPAGKAPAVEAFGTGEVAGILGIPVWRLQKFLDSPQYQLSDEGRLGEGAGSRRIFSREDIYRIAMAKHLVQDGFAAKFAGGLIEQIDDYDFHDRDAEGNEVGPGLLGLVRGTKGPTWKFFPSNRPPRLGEKDSPYYLLSLDDVIAGVDKAIAKLRE